MFQVIKDVYNTLRFNFHYLPLSQAIKVPIYLHNAILDDMKGKVIIDSPYIHRGMIVMGVWGVKIFHDKLFMWQNHGGTVVFHGKALIGAGASISVNRNASIEFGDDFLNAYGIKIIASRSITFGQGFRSGWNVLIMDTNMHPLKNKETGKKGKGGAPIKIGEFNWFSTNCVILPGVTTPERVLCGLGTVITRGIEWEPYCLYGGSPIKKLRENVYRDLEDDKDEEVYNTK